MRFASYIIRRSLLSILVLLGLTIFVFTLTRTVSDPETAYLSPQMTAAQVRAISAQYHFDQPIPVQYVYWLWGAIHGDLGLSPLYGWSPVTRLILQYFPVTAELTIYTLIFEIP